MLELLNCLYERDVCLRWFSPIGCQEVVKKEGAYRDGTSNRAILW
jgi:hypothetical protein